MFAFNTTATNMTGVELLTFDAPPKDTAPLEPDFFIDFCDIAAKCEDFVATAKALPQHPDHLVIHGLVKTGKSTVLKRIFPAIARRHIPDAIFWNYEIQQVRFTTLL